MQNTSHAVMAQRHEPRCSIDDFPTPPWATRALIEHVLGKRALRTKSCLEPACGVGHMAKALEEYFQQVTASDIHSYGFGDVGDFLGGTYPPSSSDWVITNPPFILAEAFALRALEVAKDGVALLVRASFLETVGRYERLYSQTPPSIYAPFTERVPMVAGRLDQKASTATSYAWLVWRKQTCRRVSTVRWIPPCRKRLERDSDYEG